MTALLLALLTAQDRRETAHRAATLLKPAFDEVEAAGDTLDWKPFANIRGLEDVIKKSGRFASPTTDPRLALAKDYEPVEEFVFEDLNLVCWTLAKPEPRWLFFRAIHSERRNPWLDVANGRRGQDEFAHSIVMIETTQVGDQRVPAAPRRAPLSFASENRAARRFEEMRRKLWTTKQLQVEVSGGDFRASVSLAPSGWRAARAALDGQDRTGQWRAFWGEHSFFRGALPLRPHGPDLNPNLRALLSLGGLRGGIRDGLISFRERRQTRELSQELTADLFEELPETAACGRKVRTIRHRLSLCGRAYARVYLWIDPATDLPILRFVCPARGEPYVERYAFAPVVNEQAFLLPADETPTERMEAKLDEVAYLVDRYRDAHDAYPKSIDELDDWLNESWGRRMDKTDLWGRPMIYRAAGSSFELGTLGKDGVAGGDDLWFNH